MWQRPLDEAIRRASSPRVRVESLIIREFTGPNVAHDGCPRVGRIEAFAEKLVITGLFPEADDGGRTRDLRLGKPTLYQLSYVRARSRF
jgi:hypothetical protein